MYLNYEEIDENLIGFFLAYADFFSHIRTLVCLTMHTFLIGTCCRERTKQSLEIASRQIKRQNGKLFLSPVVCFFGILRLRPGAGVLCSEVQLEGCSEKAGRADVAVKGGQLRQVVSIHTSQP